MPAKRSITRTATSSVRARTADDSVDALLATLVHPCKREIVALREVILGAHPSISDGVKWNAPSFRTSEWFATIHMRARDGVQLILHLGARPTAASANGVAVEDPRRLLQWLARDRATIVFRDMEDLQAKRGALQQLVRNWIRHVDA